MRFISPRAHGMIDWVMGPVLIALPFDLGLDLGHPSGAIFLVLGVSMLLLTAFTDHEFGVLPRLPIQTHLTVDTAAGALLALSPWLFGFHDRIWRPHLLFGLLELGLAFMTRRQPAAVPGSSAVSRA
jgi:hypothetical protein